MKYRIVRYPELEELEYHVDERNSLLGFKWWYRQRSFPNIAEALSYIDACEEINKAVTNV